MSTIRNHVLARLAFATMTLVLAATAGLLIAGTGTAMTPASHSSPRIIVNWTEKIGIATTTGPYRVNVGLLEAADADLLIAAEFEGGSNDPEIAGDEDPISYGTPDAWCLVPAGEVFCVLDLHFFTPSIGEPVRVFASTDDVVIDTLEQQSLFSSSLGCIEDEPDSTEVLRIGVVGLPQTPPPPADPAPGANPNPRTCADATASPTPSASGSPSESPSESPSGSPSESPTGDPTATATPSDSPTPTEPPTTAVFAAPFEGRYESHLCATYLPLTAQAPCEAAGEAQAASGLAEALAAVSPAEGEPATWAQADASAGVIQSVAADGRDVIARVRIHRAAIEATPSSPSLGNPYGSVAVWLAADSACGTTSTMQSLALYGPGSIENQVVEIRITPSACSTVTSITSGIQTTASTSPLSPGRIRVEAVASVERITVG